MTHYSVNYGNLTKLDVERLKSDVPKYNRAGVLDDSESTWWIETLASLEQMECDVQPTWPLEYLSTSKLQRLLLL